MIAKSTSHTIFIALGTILSLFSLASIIKFTDPYTSGLSTHTFFYLSLFMTFLGVFVLAGSLLRQKFTEGLYINQLSTSFRQGIFASLFITVSLLLQANSLYFWWTALTFGLFLFTLEFFLNLK